MNTQETEEETAPLVHDFRFDRESHTYWLNEKQIPGFHEVATATGIIKGMEFIDPFYASRGSAVHTAIELLLKRCLDESTVDPQVRPFLDSFVLWRDDLESKGYPLEVISVEHPVYCCNHTTNPIEPFNGIGCGNAYACTPDLICYIGKPSPKNPAWVIDFKTSKSPSKAHRIQTAAQAMADGIAKQRACLYLREGSIAEIKKHDDPADFKLWETALEQYYKNRGQNG